MSFFRTPRMSTVVARMALTPFLIFFGLSASAVLADSIPAAIPTVATQAPVIVQPAAPQVPIVVQPAVPQAPVVVQPAAPASTEPQAQPKAQPADSKKAADQKKQPSTDPYGFTDWLNSVRAMYGLSPVGYDPNLTNWAAANNAQQAARGLGHFVMGPARFQNSAMGSAASIGGQWLNSPAHRAALLDPTIRWIGLAGYGAYWTFNAY